MDKNQPQYHTFLLRCEGIQCASTVVAGVVEDTLIDLLASGSEPQDWRNLSMYYDYLSNRLFEADGEIKGISCSQEFWEFIKDPAGGFINYQEQVADYLLRFAQQNDSLIYTLHNRLEIQHIEVIRAFRNQWLLTAQGVKKCQ